nr:hypothetical protein GCM10020092_033530 [Actinoplanes digitatis]
MQTRDFGRLGRISALTLGGGGIGAVWGDTDRAEATATVHAAIDAGITMMDLAPSYGDDHEAERVVGEALRAKPAPEVMITSKVQLPDDEQRDFAARIRRSLHASLRRLGRTHLDLFLLHTHLRPRDAAAPNPPDNISWEHYRGEVVVEFERLRDEGLIRAWGITAVGYPATVLDALRDTPRPDAAQVIVNALDLTGDLWPFDPQPPGQRGHRRNGEPERCRGKRHPRGGRGFAHRRTGSPDPGGPPGRPGLRPRRAVPQARRRTR